jgi:hypothetical protein
MQQELRRLASLLTGRMPPDLPQDYLVASGGGTLIAGTTAPMLMTQFQPTPSGLLVPAALARRPAPFDHVGVFLTGSEILGFPPERFAADYPPTWVDEALSKIPLETVAVFVAEILRRLHGFDADQRGVELEFAGLFLPPATANRIRRLLRADPRRRLLAPQVLMVLLKVACEVATDAPLGAPPDRAMASLLLVLSEYVGTDSTQIRTSPLATPDRPGRLRRAVIANQIFHANADEAHLLGRFHYRWLHSPTSGPSDREVCNLPALFYEATGVPLGDWITVGFGLWAHIQSHGPLIHPAAHAQATGWPLDRLEAVLHLVCADAITLRMLVTRETAQLGRDWAFGTFERYPLLRLQNGMILVLDPGLLLRRFFSWLPLFDLAEGLRNAGRHRDAARAEGYMRTLSERYALSVLATAVDSPAGPRRIYDERTLKNAFTRGTPGLRIADAAIDYGDAWVVVEVTTSTLTRRSTAGVSDQDVLNDIDKLVGKVEQI